jgi:hypothetical protein
MPFVAPTGPNVLALTVNHGLGNYSNGAFASVRVCVPGYADDAHCTTVDHMLVDTGSVGVRVFASALPGPLLNQLAQVMGATNDTAPGQTSPLAQCAQFGSGFMFGSVRQADVQLGQYTASNIPLQVVSDPAYPTVPTDCKNSSLSNLGSASVMQTNGLVGIGTRERDQPSTVTVASPANYYYCPTPSACAPATVPLAKLVVQPIAMFSSDNNGTVMMFPSISPFGASTVTGYLVFGIGTQSNNGLPSGATVLATNDWGDFNTVYKGTAYGPLTSTRSFIDSGSNGYFFPDASIAQSSSGLWYVPAASLSLSGAVVGVNSSRSTPITFSIFNAATLFSTGNAAFNTLAGPAVSQFDWGLPFFYGRSIYTSISGRMADRLSGPYVAF